MRCIDGGGAGMQMILTEGPLELTLWSNLGSCQQGASHEKQLSWLQAHTPRTGHSQILVVDIRPREGISDHLLNMTPTAFESDDGLLAKNVRSARKGAVPGPSGMVVEHLRPLLDNPRDVHMCFFSMGEQLAQGMAPEVAVQAVRFVAGDVISMLTSKTMAQQLGKK